MLYFVVTRLTRGFDKAKKSKGNGFGDGIDGLDGVDRATWDVVEDIKSDQDQCP